MFTESDVREDKHLVAWPWEYVCRFLPIGRSNVQKLIGTAELAACELSMRKKKLKCQEDDMAFIRQ